MTSKPRVLIWDIETMSGSARFWGKRWDPSIVKIESYPYILCVSWTWFDIETGTWEPVQFRRKAKGKGNDKGLVRHIRNLLSEADVAVAHNGDRFDITETMARIAYHDIDPPEPFIPVDTKKLASKHFRLPSNSLNDIADYFGLGRKVQHTGYHLWDGCEKEDEVAWSTMREYSLFDTELLARVFARMYRHVKIPRFNMQQWTGRYSCMHCGSLWTQKRGKGKHRTKATAKHQVYCTRCREWSYYKTQGDEDTGEYRS